MSARCERNHGNPEKHLVPVVLALLMCQEGIPQGVIGDSVPGALGQRITLEIDLSAQHLSDVLTEQLRLMVCVEQPRSAGANWQARVEGSYENETIANVLDDMARQLGDFAWVAQSIDNRAAVSLFPRGSDETYLSQVLPSLASDEATIEEIFVSLGSEGRLELANGYFSGFGLTPSPTGFGVNERGEIQFVTNEVNEEMRQLRMDLSDLEGLTLREVLLKALLREAPSGVVYECRWWTDRQAIHFRRIMRGRNPIAPLSQGHRTAEQAEMEYLRAHPHPPTLEELHRRNEQGMSVLLMGSLTSQEVIDRFHGGVVPPGLEEIFSYPGARFIPMAGAVSVGPSPEDPQP